MSLRLASPTSSISLQPSLVLSNNYTIETWVKILTNQDTTLLAIDGFLTLDFITGPTGIIEIWWLNNPEGNTVIAVGQWYHIAVVKQGTNIKFYLSGKQFGNTVTSTQTGTASISFSAGATNLLYYNIQYINQVKYLTNFIPSADLPLNISSYAAIVYVKQSIIIGGQIAMNIENISSSTLPSTVVGVTISEDIPPGAVSIKSTICFVAGTPVLTDNFGYVPINELDTAVHTIGGKKILVVTRTVTPERHLILIKEGTLAPGVPSADTVCTANHKIKMLSGELIKSYEIPGAQLIDYHGQSLYNVALKDGENEMIVNNMTVETLDPENLIAKVHLALKDATLDQRKEILNALAVYTQKVLQEL